jgi:hypothetical protein
MTKEDAMSGRKGLKRFLDPQRATDAIDEVLAAAREDGVRVALCGGLALQLYGSDRLTADVDMIGDRLPEGDWAPLSFGGGAAEASNGVPVDVIVREDEFAPLYEAALDAAVEIDGIPVVSMEHLAVMKLVAHRAKDMQDFHWLVTHPGFDTQRAEALVREHLGPYVVGEFHSEVRTAKWEQQHSQPIRRPPMRPRGKR